jgi:hypothetical protein
MGIDNAVVATPRVFRRGGRIGCCRDITLAVREVKEGSDTLPAGRLVEVPHPNS